MHAKRMAGTPRGPDTLDKDSADTVSLGRPARSAGRIAKHRKSGTMALRATLLPEGLAVCASDRAIPLEVNTRRPPTRPEDTAARMPTQAAESRTCGLSEEGDGDEVKRRKDRRARTTKRGSAWFDASDPPPIRLPPNRRTTKTSRSRQRRTMKPASVEWCTSLLDRQGPLSSSQRGIAPVRGRYASLVPGSHWPEAPKRRPSRRRRRLPGRGRSPCPPPRRRRGCAR